MQQREILYVDNSNFADKYKPLVMGLKELHELRFKNFFFKI